MDSSSQNMRLNSAEFDLIMGELRLVKMELECITKTIVEEKLKKKLLGNWIPEKEVLEVMNISRGKLFMLYKEGKIAKTTLGSKGNYYNPDDFRKILDENVNK